jgi:hypothetical protein
MDFERALEYGLEGQAVRFVSPGFPRRATNVRHKLLKLSVELAAAGAEQSAAVSGHYGSADRRASLCASRRHNNSDWFARKAVQDSALVFIGSFRPHLPRLCPHFLAHPRPARGSLFIIGAGP